MQTLRRLVRFCLGLQALGLLGGVPIVFGVIAGIRQADDEVTRLTWVLALAIALVIPLLNLIPVIAWWKLKKSKPSARGWVIGASVLNLLIGVADISTWTHSGRTPTSWIYAMFGVTGILGLIAFWRKDEATPQPVKAPKAVRLPGDGTSKAKDYTAQIVSVGILWLAYHFLNRWSAGHDMKYPGIIPALLLLQVAIVVNTFGHELGHFIAGWASGMILRRFQVGPLLWTVRNGLWGFELQWKHFYGGAVGMVSPRLDNIRGREAFMIAGGPVASLVMAACATVATLSAKGHAWEPYWALLSMIAAMGWSAFAVNLIPLKTAANYSDGAQLYQIISGGEWAQFHLAFGMVASSLVTAIRPRDFDVATINRAAEFITQGKNGMLLRLFASKHYIEADMIPEGLASMEAAEVLYEQSWFEKPEDICAEFVFLNAFYKRDLAAAEVWSRRIDALSKVEIGADYWRALTAVLWLKGEREKAGEAWALGNRLALKLPAAGAYDSTRRCFAQLREVLDEPESTTPPPLRSLDALAAALREERIEDEIGYEARRSLPVVAAR
jgi:hypothetical protein